MAKPHTLDRTLQVRTSAKQVKQLEKLAKVTTLSEAELVRYAVSTLPHAADLDGDSIADLVYAVRGRLPGQLH